LLLAPCWEATALAGVALHRTRAKGDFNPAALEKIGDALSQIFGLRREREIHGGGLLRRAKLMARSS